MLKVTFEKLRDDVVLPSQATKGSAGYDITYIGEPIGLFPGERKLIKCGFKMIIPEGYECQVRPRSGLALKKGITVLNSPGTIDSDYRNEVGVILINTSTEQFVLNNGERIGQLVFHKYEEIEIIEGKVEIEDTNTRTGGFGSTSK